MPMLDVTIPEGALSDEAEQQLLERLTDLLLEQEGADPRHPVSRAITWAFVHRPVRTFVAGAEETEPHYRVVATAPEGLLDDERRRALVASVTEAVLDAEEGHRPRDPSRVWVFPTDRPDGTWGSAGQIHRLEDIITMVYGDRDKAQRFAEARLHGPSKPLDQVAKEAGFDVEALRASVEA